MALQGSFSADFSDFYRAVEQAQVKLRGFEGDAIKLGAALSKATDQFSGRDIIEQATIAAKAIENVGGTTKLTAEELAKVGALIDEASAKLQAMGQDVPESFQAITKA